MCDGLTPTPDRTGTHSEESRSVNQLLANLRRVGVSGGPNRSDALAVHPTVPPAIRNILQLPETPAPRPRRPVRHDAAGRRLPPGPAAPQSWLDSSRHASQRRVNRDSWEKSSDHRLLPGAYQPERGSLMDLVLRRFAVDWDFQKTYCQYYLYDLPTHIRIPLVRYVSLLSGEGVSISDLRSILLPPLIDPEEGGNPADEDDPSSVNESFTHLDLTGAVGRSLKLRDLSDLIWPAQPELIDLPDSWDAPDEQAATLSASVTGVPRSLLPNLTHLSLALDPDLPSSVTWRHLLAFASRQNKLTHLSLAFWPEPTLTPNAKISSVVTREGHVVQYGGTGPYSHSLDNDWSEAIMVVSRLSRSLYELEYLDLTGCASWSPALWSTADHDTVDWVGHWGKISTILLYPGHQLPEDASIAEMTEYSQWRGYAVMLERHVRGRRAGQGRFITVEAGG